MDRRIKYMHSVIFSEVGHKSVKNRAHKYICKKSQAT